MRSEPGYFDLDFVEKKILSGRILMEVFLELIKDICRLWILDKIEKGILAQNAKFLVSENLIENISYSLQTYFNDFQINLESCSIEKISKYIDLYLQSFFFDGPSNDDTSFNKYIIDNSRYKLLIRAFRDDSNNINDRIKFAVYLKLLNNHLSYNNKKKRLYRSDIKTKEYQLKSSLEYILCLYILSSLEKILLDKVITEHIWDKFDVFNENKEKSKVVAKWENKFAKSSRSIFLIGIGGRGLSVINELYSTFNKDINEITADADYQLEHCLKIDSIDYYISSSYLGRKNSIIFRKRLSSLKNEMDHKPIFNIAGSHITSLRSINFTDPLVRNEQTLDYLKNDSMSMIITESLIETIYRLDKLDSKRSIINLKYFDGTIEFGGHVTPIFYNVTGTKGKTTYSKSFIESLLARLVISKICNSLIDNDMKLFENNYTRSQAQFEGVRNSEKIFTGTRSRLLRESELNLSIHNNCEGNCLLNKMNLASHENLTKFILNYLKKDMHRKIFEKYKIKNTKIEFSLLILTNVEYIPIDYLRVNLEFSAAVNNIYTDKYLHEHFILEIDDQANNNFENEFMFYSAKGRIKQRRIKRRRKPRSCNNYEDLCNLKMQLINIFKKNEKRKIFYNYEIDNLIMNANMRNNDKYNKSNSMNNNKLKDIGSTNMQIIIKRSTSEETIHSNSSYYVKWKFEALKLIIFLNYLRSVSTYLTIEMLVIYKSVIIQRNLSQRMRYPNKTSKI